MFATQLLFQLLIVFLPSQLAFHFWPKSAFVFGIRSDYLSPAVFATDILLLLLLISSLPKLKKQIILFIVLGLIFGLINISQSLNWPISLFKWLKVVELGVFIIWLKQNAIWVKKWLRSPLLISILWISVLAIWQFILQKTVNGPFYFLGERSFTANTPGIALFNGFLRSYSTFGHPNVLAGYLLVATFVFFSLKPSLTKISKIILTLALIAFILSFSQSAWLVGFVILFLIFRKKFSQKLVKILLLKNISSALIFLLIAFSLILPLVGQSLSVKNESIQKRFDLSVVSVKVFQKSPFFGIGLGSFVRSLPFIAKDESSLVMLKTVWWLQPVHNIYLLILTEMGLVGLIMVGFLLTKVLKNLVKKKNLLLTASFLGILILGLFDHYWLTQQQTLFLFALVIGLSS